MQKRKDEENAWKASLTVTSATGDIKKPVTTKEKSLPTLRKGATLDNQKCVLLEDVVLLLYTARMKGDYVAVAFGKNIFYTTDLPKTANPQDDNFQECLDTIYRMHVGKTKSEWMKEDSGEDLSERNVDRRVTYDEALYAYKKSRERSNSKFFGEEK